MPGARARAERGELAFGTIDTWLVWKLTGGGLHVTDPSNASRTMLYDIVKGDWDDELLGWLDVPRGVLPEVRASSEVLGQTAAGVFDAAIPIAGIAGDQQAALFGQQCFTRGLAKNTYGTGCFMLMNIGREAAASKHQPADHGGMANRREHGLRAGRERLRRRRRRAVAARRPGRHRLLGGGRAAGRLGAGCWRVYLVPAFAGLGAPHWDQYARGLIVGMTRGTTKAHLARAALEGIAFQVADVLDVMKADSGIALDELRVDGGAAANDLLMQFQADILGVPVARPKVIETTALGAAFLAGLAVGYWASSAELKEAWQIDRRFEPRMGGDERASRRARWTRALERARDWEQA